MISFVTNYANFVGSDTLSFYAPFDDLVARFSVYNPLPRWMQLRGSSTAVVVLRSVANATRFEFSYKCTSSGHISVFGRHIGPFWFGLVLTASLLLFCSLFSTVVCYLREQRNRNRLLSLSRVSTYREQQELQEMEERTLSQLKALPARSYDYDSAGGEATDDCSICLESFQRGDTVRELPCKHCFHRSCIDEWFKRERFRRRTCPLCKGGALPAPGARAASPAGQGGAGEAPPEGAAAEAEAANNASDSEGPEAAVVPIVEGENDLERAQPVGAADAAETQPTPSVLGRGT